MSDFPTLPTRWSRPPMPQHLSTSTPTSSPSSSSFSSPAFTHNLASSIIRCRTLEREGVAPLNAMLFLCFQSNHIVMRHFALVDFRLCPVESSLVHHALSSSPISGSRPGLPVINPNKCQTCLANTHPIRRCWMVSSSWLQSGHVSWCGRPRLARRSEIQHLFLKASQAKKRHQRGAREPQVNSATGDTSRPINLAV